MSSKETLSPKSVRRLEKITGKKIAGATTHWGHRYLLIVADQNHINCHKHLVLTGHPDWELLPDISQFHHELCHQLFPTKTEAQYD